MWEIFESDKVILFLVIAVLISIGVITHKLFLQSLDFVGFISVIANLATISVSVFAFWEYKKWKLSANNSEIHKTVLDFAVYLQSFDLVIPRIISHSNREQFIEDYESWTKVYLALLQFQAKYNFLTNGSVRSFEKIGFPNLGELERRFLKMHTIKMLACNDFKEPHSKGAGLLWSFLQGEVKKDGKFNVYHLSWTKELTYENFNFDAAIKELKALVHTT